MELEIIPELWREIKTYLFHNIKTQGKHFKKDKHIMQFNEVLLQLPRIHQPHLGARILYRNHKFPYAKFLYCVPPPNKRCWSITGKKKFIIIEYFYIPRHYVIGPRMKDVRIRQYYYKNIHRHSPRRIEY